MTYLWQTLGILGLIFAAFLLGAWVGGQDARGRFLVRASQAAADLATCSNVSYMEAYQAMVRIYDA